MPINPASMNVQMPESSVPQINIGDILRQRQAQHLQEIQEMKDMAEFQQNLRLQGIAKEMQMQGHSLPGSTAGPGTMNLGAGATARSGGVQLGAGANQIANERLAIEQAKEAEAARQNKVKNDLAAQEEARKQSATETPEQKATRQQNDITTRGTQAQNLENTRQTGRLQITQANNTTKTNINKANNDAKANLQGVKGQQMLDAIAARGKAAIATKSTPSGTSSANNDLVGRMNTAQQMINENPEWAKYIHIDPNTKNVTVDQPAAPGFFGGGNGLDADTHAKILDRLYGARPNASGGQPNTTQQTTTPQPTHIPVTGKDGKPYFFDTTKNGGQIPPGYTAVGGGGDDESQDEESDQGSGPVQLGPSEDEGDEENG